MSCLQVDLLSLPEQRLATFARSVGYVVRHIFPVFAARDQTKHLSMIVVSGEDVQLVCPAHKHFLTNVTKLTVPLQLKTAEGDLTLDVVGDLLFGDIVCHGCVFKPLVSVSLFSTVRGEKDGYLYERCGVDCYPECGERRDQQVEAYRLCLRSRS